MSRALALFAWFFITACASSGAGLVKPVPQAQVGQTDSSWHSCRARWHWSEGVGPPWGGDGLLAVAVFAPLVESADLELSLWRFHRRAARDDAGRRFSFIYRGTASSADSIRHWIKTHPMVHALLEDGVLEEMDCSEVAYWSGTSLAATSDKNWSEVMQQVWPYYINGVSRMWLALMQEQIGPMRGERTLQQLLRDSERAHQITTGIWQLEGQHALLHHLSSVFGYQPLLIRY